MKFYIRKIKYSNYIIWLLRIGRIKLTVSKLKKNLEINLNYRKGWTK